MVINHDSLIVILSHNYVNNIAIVITIMQLSVAYSDCYDAVTHKQTKHQPLLRS